MAGASLLVLLDDIVAVLDDVALMTKAAAQKTAGMLSDDLAVNAGQLSGIRAERELPVVWAVAKGSLLNKAILVPSALLVSVFMPWLIAPVLVAGGLFLCFEGFEKIAGELWRSRRRRQDAQVDGRVSDSQPANSAEVQVAKPDTSAAITKSDLLLLERRRIRGAIRTDLILSAEIIVVTLGMVQDESFMIRAAVVVAIALFMTIGVYGLVAMIVKLDDLGVYLVQAGSAPGSTLAGGKLWLGEALLSFAPLLMRTLSWIGTIAMFLVGGGILLHELPLLHALQAYLVAGSSLTQGLIALGLSLMLGIIAGALALATVHLFACARGLFQASGKTAND